MHIPKVVFLRYSGVETHQISEDMVRDIGRALNKGRESSNKITPAYLYLEQDNELSDIPDVVMAIRSGVSLQDQVHNDIYYFRSPDSMQNGIVKFLKNRYPIPTPHPELELKAPPGFR